MTTYMVKAETHEGDVLTLRKGLATEDAAKEHPVTLSRWKRVWVEPDETPPVQPKVSTLPPFPWDLTTSAKPDASGRFHAYLVDATGKKIAAIWGSDSERKLVADFIVDAANTMRRVDEDTAEMVGHRSMTKKVASEPSFK